MELRVFDAVDGDFLLLKSGDQSVKATEKGIWGNGVIIRTWKML